MKIKILLGRTSSRQLKRIVLFSPHMEMVLGCASNAERENWARLIETTINVGATLAGTLKSITTNCYEVAIEQGYHIKSVTMIELLGTILPFEYERKEPFSAVLLPSTIVCFIYDVLKKAPADIQCEADALDISPARYLHDIYYSSMRNPKTAKAFSPQSDNVMMRTAKPLDGLLAMHCGSYKSVASKTYDHASHVTTITADRSAHPI